MDGEGGGVSQMDVFFFREIPESTEKQNTKMYVDYRWLPRIYGEKKTGTQATQVKPAWS